ncbi:hypothetical protein C8Q75DRAFT_806412 [Abortiporus biennis]|nr:hypothetical protein C8Q75DRAFT_806412 [Abortiporus biennis]
MPHTEFKLIAVLGSASSGKSEFVELLRSSGSSSTEKPKGITRHWLSSQGVSFVLLDTPEFDGKLLRDADVLTMVQKELFSTFDPPRSLDGILWLCGPPSNTKGAKPLVLNFTTIQTLCGTSDLSKVAVVANVWGKEGLVVENGVEALKSTLKPAVSKKAQLHIHDNTSESAHNIVSSLLQPQFRSSTPTFNGFTKSPTPRSRINRASFDSRASDSASDISRPQSRATKRQSEMGDIMKMVNHHLDESRSTTPVNGLQLDQVAKLNHDTEGETESVGMMSDQGDADKKKRKRKRKPKKKSVTGEDPVTEVPSASTQTIDDATPTGSHTPITDDQLTNMRRRLDETMSRVEQIARQLEHERSERIRLEGLLQQAVQRSELLTHELEHQRNESSRVERLLEQAVDRADGLAKKLEAEKSERAAVERRLDGEIDRANQLAQKLEASEEETTHIQFLLQQAEVAHESCGSTISELRELLDGAAVEVELERAMKDNLEARCVEYADETRLKVERLEAVQCELEIRKQEWETKEAAYQTRIVELENKLTVQQHQPEESSDSVATSPSPPEAQPEPVRASVIPEIPDDEKREESPEDTAPVPAPAASQVPESAAVLPPVVTAEPSSASPAPEKTSQSEPAPDSTTQTGYLTEKETTTEPNRDSITADVAKELPSLAGKPKKRGWRKLLCGLV